MAQMLGSDPQDMQDLISKLDHAIDQIGQVTSALESKVQSVRWEGPDANRFKHTEWPTSKKALTRVATDLGNVKTVVTRQRQQQIDTSAH